MNDLISRQAAIDFIDAGRLCNPNEPRWSDNEIVNFLRSRPSAEPEIIICRDCKFWTHIKRTNRYWCKTDDGLYDLNPSPDDFCSRAERRTDE